jgi:hypothetical protein
MALQISISNAIGARAVAGGGGIDPDAQAFITAASITDPTQQSAINQLVVDLKGYSIWTKMKALYPFVGGTASTHKFNLKDPRDLDAAYRLVFSGGWTHSSTGALPNGTNAFANTFLVPNSVLSLNSTHISSYLRTNLNSDAPILSAENAASYSNGLYIWPKQVLFGYSIRINDNTSQGGGTNTDDIRGLHIASRTASNVKKYRLNTSQKFSVTTASQGLNTDSIYIGASRNNANYFNNQIAFASIGDGLTDTEELNFYTAVQAFQTTLGRSIGTQTVSDADAQAFVTNAGIVDQVEANAINNLVIGLKADSLWTKMKAIYPFVGGTASTHKYNLKDPRDLDAAFRIFWNGGVTHSSNGVQFGGVNGWAETYLNANTAFTTNDSFHGSIYSRTNSNIDAADYGGVNASARTELWIRGADGNLYTSAHLNRIITPNSNSTGYYISTRTNSTTFKVFKNNSQLGSTYTGANGARLDVTMPIGAYKIGTTPLYFSNRQYAFASIGDGLTDTEAANFYTAVQAFQTSLNRQIP